MTEATERQPQWKATHRHYKGGLYRVIGEAVHTETSAFLTIYDNEQGNIFARPQGMFYGTIEDGTPRFRSLLPKEAGKA